ncbi:MAG TPA: NifU family protein [Verrucomicrobiae bacterium]|nr:NifU family protein [Verrucomicrobiae bacterium]
MSTSVLKEPLVCVPDKPAEAPRETVASNPARERPGAVGAPGAVDPHTARFQDVLDKIQAFPNPAARVLMEECLQSLLALYGEGLERIMHILRASEAKQPGPVSDMARDPLLRALLLIHGLHPQDLETRLRSALDSVRPYMMSHGGNVELAALDGGFALLRLQGTCKTCPSSTVTLELAVRRAVEEACPDLAGFEVEKAS